MGTCKPETVVNVVIIIIIHKKTFLINGYDEYCAALIAYIDTMKN